MGRDVIIACDFNSKEEVVSFLSKFQDEKPFVKIGMELFYAEGPEIVRTIKKMGHKIFLDLKLQIQSKNPWQYYQTLMLICATFMRQEPKQ